MTTSTLRSATAILIVGLFGAVIAAPPEGTPAKRMDPICYEILAAFDPVAVAEDAAKARDGVARDVTRLAAHAEAFARLEEAVKALKRPSDAAELARLIECLNDLAPLTDRQKAAAQALHAIQQLRDSRPDAETVRRLLADIRPVLSDAAMSKLQAELSARPAGNSDAGSPPLGVSESSAVAELALGDVVRQREQYRRRSREVWQKAEVVYRGPTARPAATAQAPAAGQPDEDERYLRAVEALLGRQLDPVEVGLVLALRRNGLSPAAAVRVVVRSAETRSAKP